VALSGRPLRRQNWSSGERPELAGAVGVGVTSEEVETEVMQAEMVPGRTSSVWRAETKDEPEEGTPWEWHIPQQQQTPSTQLQSPKSMSHHSHKATKEVESTRRARNWLFYSLRKCNEFPAFQDSLRK
jgi:hypothetical protein